MAALPTELLSLLHACKEEPDDDTPRLVLADWLEENGETAHGQLMRLQVRAARMSLRECAEQRTASRTHELTLLCRHHLAPLLGAGLQAEFQRGLLFVRAPLAFARAGTWRRVLSSGIWPWVESVEITGTCWGHLGLHAWRNAGLLQDVPEWRLIGIYLGDMIATFFNEPATTIPRALAILPWRVSNDAMERLGASRLAPSLRSLSLERARIRRTQCAALAAAPWTLRELALEGNRAGDVGAVELSAAPWMAGLSSFRAERANIGPRGLRALLKAGALWNARRLDLSENRLGLEGARAIATSATLPNLRELNLSENRLGDEGALALAMSPRLDHINRLTLWGNGITSTARVELEERFGERVLL